MVCGKNSIYKERRMEENTERALHGVVDTVMALLAIAAMVFLITGAQKLFVQDRKYIQQNTTITDQPAYVQDYESWPNNSVYDGECDLAEAYSIVAENIEACNGIYLTNKNMQGAVNLLQKQYGGLSLKENLKIGNTQILMNELSGGNNSSVFNIYYDLDANGRLKGIYLARK